MFGKDHTFSLFQAEAQYPLETGDSLYTNYSVNNFCKDLAPYTTTFDRNWFLKKEWVTCDSQFDNIYFSEFWVIATSWQSSIGDKRERDTPMHTR